MLLKNLKWPKNRKRYKCPLCSNDSIKCTLADGYVCKKCGHYFEEG